MPVCVVLGAQWGDEGKGKIVDYLAKDADMIARFNGGNNAGHTVINEMGRFELHLLPAGVLHSDKMALIGNGCVVNPEAILIEIDKLRESNIDVEGRLKISDRAHLIMPYHVRLDNLSEYAKGGAAIGTTGSGIGPTYADKASRTGIRAGDLLDLKALKATLKKALDHHNAVITKVYSKPPISFDEIFRDCKKWASRLGPFIGPVEDDIYDALEDGKMLLVEGAQGAMLDIDYGTYPYVTSSNPTIGGVCTGLGLQPKSINSVVGVLKAYSTRVGNGPFVTEMPVEIGDELRDIAHEYGVTTNRGRRIGWLDIPVARFSARINGYTSLALTRLDILDYLDTIKICTGYEVDDQPIKGLPGNSALLERCKPVYEEIEGWDEPTAGVTCMEALPVGARNYIRRVEELVGIPVDIVSTGPKRHETIAIRNVY